MTAKSAKQAQMPLSLLRLKKGLTDKVDWEREWQDQEESVHNHPRGIKLEMLVISFIHTPWYMAFSFLQTHTRRAMREIS